MFDGVFCINLDRREDRWHDFARRHKESDWNLQRIERLSAADGRTCKPDRPWIASSGAWGCFQSHLHAWRLAKERGYRSVLIFEDDAMIAKDFTGKLTDLMKSVPNDWLGLHLEIAMPRLKKSQPLDAKVYRAFHVLATCCYAIREPLLSLVIEGEKYNNTHVDQYLTDFQLKLPWYAPGPAFAPVRHGRSKSDIDWATSQ